MPDPFDRDHVAQGMTMQFVHQASYLPTVSSSSAPLANELAGYDRDRVVSFVAALLTEPSLHDHTLRIEALLHLALAHCAGKSSPRRSHIARWLNDYLGRTQLRLVEDPPEDAFVTNVVTARGNRRIFQGNWIGNDFWLQDILECLWANPETNHDPNLHEQIEALLFLSDALADRCELSRGTLGGGNPQEGIEVPENAWLFARSRAVVFTPDDLKRLAISASSLTPFLLSDHERSGLVQGTLGSTALEHHPVCEVSGGWSIVIPSAVANAAINRVIAVVQRSRRLDQLEAMLRAKQAQRAFNEALGGMKTEPAARQLPSRPASLTSCDVVAERFDDDKSAVVLLLHDELAAALRDGMACYCELEAPVMEALNAYLRECVRSASTDEAFVSGLLVVVMGGIGRGFHLFLDDLPPEWELLVFSLSDFSSLGWVERMSLLRLWKLVRERRRLQQNGVSVFNGNGDFNLFAHWHNAGYRLIQSHVPFPAKDVAFAIEPTSVASLRQTLRGGYDAHGVAYADRWLIVQRKAMRSFFDDSEDRRIFVSSERAQVGHLCGVAEIATRGWWVESQPNRARKVSADIHFRLWEGLLNWMSRFAAVLEQELPELPPGPIHVWLHIDGLETWTEFQIGSISESEIKLPKVAADRARRRIWLKVPATFLKLFQRADNDGERELLLAICLGATTLAGVRVTRHRANEIVSRAMPNSKARFFHAVPAADFRSRPAPEMRSQPRFLCEEDKAASRLGIVPEFWPRPNAPQDIATACTFFENCVEFVWKRIRATLCTLDRQSTITRGLRNIEAIAADKDQWDISAQALLAWYNDAAMVTKRAMQRESDRSIAAIASRVLVEMAVCTCPARDGLMCSRAHFDAFIADIELLIVTAHTSDAVRSGFASPRVTFTPSGEFIADTSFMREVVGPYMAGHFEDSFTASAKRYAEHFQENPPAADAPVMPQAFVDAVHAEYGLPPMRIAECNTALEDAARETKSAVMALKESEVAARLKAAFGIRREETDRFLQEFALHPRVKWDEPEPGAFRRRDWYPWRFRRRLSLYSRPLVRLPDGRDPTILFAAGLASEAFQYVLSGAYTGDLPAEYFLSRKMRAWIGGVNNERGHRFNREMAAHFEKAGWRSEASVKMTRFGAPGDLGDVDVLAWDPTLRSVLVIECKRLQMARTIGEIVEQLKRFKGETEDELGVHLRRFDWLRDHLDAVRSFTGMSTQPDSVEVVLLTNTTIPTRYLPQTSIRKRNIITAADIMAFASSARMAS